MNICMVLADRDFPPDIRVENEIESLINAGHEVVLVVQGQYNRSLVSEWHDCRIYRIFSPTHLVLKKLNALIFLIFNYNYQWASFLNGIVKKHDINAIHIHDLPMAKTGLSIARKNRIPLIIDLHEHYPEFLQITKPVTPNLKERIYYALFYNPNRWRTHEKKVLLQTHRSIVVAEEAAERIAALGVPRNKIVLVRNTVNVDRFCSYPLLETVLSEYREFFIISYIGGLDRFRGISTVVRALPMVIIQNPDTRLLLVGPKKDESLDALIRQMNLVSHVFFTGWKNFSHVPSYMAASDLAVLIHESNEHIETTLPHKLFQYMLAGKPVIVSNCAPMKRVVTEANCGLIVEPGDPLSLAEAVLKLQDANLREKLGNNGREAVLNRYNWKIDAGRLINMYVDLQ